MAFSAAARVLRELSRTLHAESNPEPNVLVASGSNAAVVRIGCIDIAALASACVMSTRAKRRRHYFVRMPGVEINMSFHILNLKTYA
jgi:hypothetical protein